MAGRCSQSGLVSMKVNMRGSMGRMLYADDLAVVVESGREMQEILGGGRRNLVSIG